jgi:hypothetical protein
VTYVLIKSLWITEKETDAYVGVWVLNKNKAKIMESTKASVLLSVKGPHIYSCDPFLEKMAKDLHAYRCSEERPPHST